jgi:hypothetical protein
MIARKNAVSADGFSMSRRYYIDTSAYLCVLLGEKGHQRLEREFAGAELLSSVVLVLETRRNLVRHSRQRLISPADFNGCLLRMEQDLELFTLRDLTLDLCTSKAMPVISTPRSLDLAHLRTALWFHEQEPVTRFVTLDDEQEQAAIEMGLPV